MFLNDWHAWNHIHSGFHNGSPIALASSVKCFSCVKADRSCRICVASFQSAELIWRGSVTPSMRDVVTSWRLQERMRWDVAGEIFQMFFEGGCVVGAL